MKKEKGGKKILGVKEIALRNDLKKWRRKITKMIKELDKALTPMSGLLDSDITRKKCLNQLKELREEMKTTIDSQEHGAWIQ